jgi:hypothetical protein
MNHAAIYATHSNVVLIKEENGLECFDVDGNTVTIDQSLADAWVDPNAWFDSRKEAYPSWEDQLDMQYWDGVNDTTTWADAIAKVKADNPKGDA